jgi:kynurenine formamidase
MSKIIDLTHPFTAAMPVHAYDEPASIKQVRTLEKNYYNDWLLSSGMHVGTHIDGPGHLTDSKLLLSNVPVEQFVARGYLVDVRGQTTIDASLLRNMPNEEGMIVLICTGFDKKFGTPAYFENYPVMTPEFAQELVKRKIKMVGTDCFSPDKYPFEVHKIFFAQGIFIAENLANLERLVGVKNFTVVALPLKTETDSALTRVVVIID